MAFSVLSRAYRRLAVFKNEIVAAQYSTQRVEMPVTINPVIINSVITKVEEPMLKQIRDHLLTPRSISLNFDVPRHRFPLSKIIECPILPNFQIDEPIKNNIDKSDIIPNKVIEIPTTTNIIEKRAERMIIIRRKKMKKHKRRKFLKKMKFVILKRENKKRVLKEKIFVAELQDIYAKALKFDPKQYVAERIKTLTIKRLPNRWRGELLPEYMIKQFIKEKQDNKAHKLRLYNYRLKLDE